VSRVLDLASIEAANPLKPRLRRQVVIRLCWQRFAQEVSMDDSRIGIVECRNCGAHIKTMFGSGVPGPEPAFCAVCGTIAGYGANDVVRGCPDGGLARPEPARRWSE
jgi:hypothetical protein